MIISLLLIFMFVHVLNIDNPKVKSCDRDAINFTFITVIYKIAEEKAETVKKSNKAGLTVETIADITGLTIEEINAILNGKAG
jgi:hypothetical protein